MDDIIAFALQAWEHRERVLLDAAVAAGALLTLIGALRGIAATLEKLAAATATKRDDMAARALVRALDIAADSVRWISALLPRPATGLASRPAPASARRSSLPSAPRESWAEPDTSPQGPRARRAREADRPPPRSARR